MKHPSTTVDYDVTTEYRFRSRRSSPHHDGSNCCHSSGKSESLTVLFPVFFSSTFFLIRSRILDTPLFIPLIFLLLFDRPAQNFGTHEIIKIWIKYVAKWSKSCWSFQVWTRSMCGLSPVFSNDKWAQYSPNVGQYGLCVDWITVKDSVGSQ